jgi:RNA polymerase sigma factor (sigma-70 family)
VSRDRRLSDDLWRTASRAAAGDRQAADQLVEGRLGIALWHLAGRFAQSMGGALWSREDLFQEAWVFMVRDEWRVLRAALERTRESLDRDRDLVSYTVASVQNRLIDIYRGVQRSPALVRGLDSVAEEMPDRDGLSEEAILHTLVAGKALGYLAGAEKEVVQRRLIGDSAPEIAAAMGVTMRRVHHLWESALKKLRRLLG